MKVIQYSSIGKRSLNEDSNGSNSNCSVICDGVGGSQRGEVASSFVVQEMLAHTSELKIESESQLHTIVLKIQEAMSYKVLDDDHLEGMATTLAFVYLSCHGLFIGHIGDSRITFILDF